ncbi:membrane protein [Cronobacter phage vB_CsaM_GAP32]|uniref:Putative membrane protein n=1 Tax=Cronobacter phage vB_CsaM_GAP32 TaxID=1141136 RepID=K4F7C9_9CAUD|nr:membrane protein [Cronobacter phage vB_CsaM_GAP32]AFC21988.1 putative membrane protein [Cronobacter phage vB_CsaM_GAP32]
MTFTILCHIVNGLVLLLAVLCVLDWTLAKDKLNPAIEKFCEKHISPEYACPIFGCIFIALLSAIGYLVFGGLFFSTMYLVSTGTAMVMVVIVLVFMALTKGLSSIRKYILSKKK